MCSIVRKVCGVVLSSGRVSTCTCTRCTVDTVVACRMYMYRYQDNDLISRMRAPVVDSGQASGVRWECSSVASSARPYMYGTSTTLSVFAWYHGSDLDDLWRLVAGVPQRNCHAYRSWLRRCFSCSLFCSPASPASLVPIVWHRRWSHSSRSAVTYHLVTDRRSLSLSHTHETLHTCTILLSLSLCHTHTGTHTLHIPVPVHTYTRTHVHTVCQALVCVSLSCLSRVRIRLLPPYVASRINGCRNQLFRCRAQWRRGVFGFIAYISHNIFRKLDKHHLHPGLRVHIFSVSLARASSPSL